MPYMIQAIIGGVAEMALHNNLDAMEEATIGDWAIARRTAAIAICGTVDPDAQVANWGRIDRFNTAAYEATHRFWEEHREAIINVAEALVERRALTGAEVAMLVEASKVTADEPPAG